MRALLSRDDRRIADERIVNPWVRHKVGLEFGQVDVQGAIEAERSGDGTDNLCDQSVEVLVGRAWDVEVAVADVVDGLIVN